MYPDQNKHTAFNKFNPAVDTVQNTATIPSLLPSLKCDYKDENLETSHEVKGLIPSNGGHCVTVRGVITLPCLLNQVT